MDAVSASDDVRWPAWAKPFLDEFARTGSPIRAAGVAGVHHGTPQRLRAKSRTFAEAWDRAAVEALRPTSTPKWAKIDPAVWHPVFLAELGRGRTVSQAVAVAGVLPRVAWADRRADPEFAAAWEGALAKVATRRAAVARRAAAAMHEMEAGKVAG